MRKIVLIPDSFKGTLSSLEICRIMGECIRARFPECQVVSIPVADGGEGSVDAFLTALGGVRVPLTVCGPFFEPTPSFYGLLPDGTAVIEMAACAGLPLAGKRLDPGAATTYGVGQLMLHAAEQGARRIIVGLGGSASNDGGCGAAAAAGVRFINEKGAAFIPTGDTLCHIAAIDVSHPDPRLDGVTVTAMCDIDNPLYGPSGAACIFGPQKGADPAQVAALDAGLRHLSDVIRRDLGRDLSSLPGGGAAGGMGAGMAVFFGASLQMGIETVLDAVRFDDVIADADMIFTGEGRIDAQSLRGKVVIGVARRAGRQHKPVIAVVGGAGTGIESAYDQGVTAIFSINRLPQDLSVSRGSARENLAFAMENILRLLALSAPEGCS